MSEPPPLPEPARAPVVIGDARRWKAMSHPLRREMLRQIGQGGAVTSTTIAKALGVNTGTTSYHLRILADAGVIEELTDRGRGRERWWRQVPVDLREPDYDSLDPQSRAALDEWRATQIPRELALVNRFVREIRSHGQWAKSSRAGGWFTLEGLEAVFEGYLELVKRHSFSPDDAPPEARPMLLRMFYLPEEPPGQGADAADGSGG
jgi:DNA-binding transcriptional ArsR family regulator